MIRDAIGLDLRQTKATHVIGDIRWLPFQDACCDTLYAHDVLEHVLRDDVSRVLSEIRRILKEGGRAEIRVPDLDELFSMRAQRRLSEKEFERRIFGGQAHRHDVHYSGFTGALMQTYAEEARLQITKRISFNGNAIYEMQR